MVNCGQLSSTAATQIGGHHHDGFSEAVQLAGTVAANTMLQLLPDIRDSKVATMHTSMSGAVM
jgi:hypothetical protein